MRYRIAQTLLVIFGLFFAVGALNFPPVIAASRASTAYFMGTLLGHALFAIFAVYCFIWFRRAGIKAKTAKFTTPA
jgi:hypothetical protein